MQKMWSWIRNNGLAITAVTGIGALSITVANVLSIPQRKRWELQNWPSVRR